jgi:hypothetical protein
MGRDREPWLANKQAIIEQVVFDLSFFKPVA